LDADPPAQGVKIARRITPSLRACLFLSVVVLQSRRDSFTIPVSFTNIMRRVKGELMPLQATFDVFTIRVVLAICRLILPRVGRNRGHGRCCALTN